MQSQQNQINNNTTPDLQQTCCLPKCGGRGSQRNGSINKLRLGNDTNTTSAQGVEEEESELVAVIVSIRRGGSYDELFTMVQQKSEPGTHVNTYLVEDVDADKLLELCSINFDEKRSYIEREWGEDACDMLVDINSVDPDSVVFNWECCGGCGDHGFGNIKSLMPLFSFLLHKRSFMVMCSDFSLKALIHEWDNEVLGVNPLKNVGTFGTQVILRFDPGKLRDCEDSNQLQILGELCTDSGKACVHAMSGTIAYTVDKSVTPQNHPDKSTGWTELDVLTFATELDGNRPENFTKIKTELLKIDRYSALAGHCLFRFPSEGRLLVSSPHWIELSKLDVSKVALFQVAEERYGAKACADMQVEYDAMNDDLEREAYIQKKSGMFVQQSAPSKYSKRKG